MGNCLYSDLYDMYLFMTCRTLNQELQQQSANLITVTATVYVIIFTMAILIYSIYANHLKTQQAIHRVKVSIFTNCV